MSRETLPSDEDGRTSGQHDDATRLSADGERSFTPSDSERSPDQPPRAVLVSEANEGSSERASDGGLKGAGRSRPKGLVVSAGNYSRFGLCGENREYPTERPRPTGGFLKVLLGIPDSRERAVNTEKQGSKTGKEFYNKERASDNSPRAQTSIDFVVGMSVFLLTVAFVVAFLPGVFEPFTASDEGDVLAADRTATLLSEQLLAEPTNPGALDAGCTAAFFDADASDDEIDDCRFDADASDLDTALGLGPATAANVTVEENGSVHSLDRGGSPVELRAGSEPPESENVVVSRRVVLLDGEERDLIVRVW